MTSPQALTEKSDAFADNMAKNLAAIKASQSLEAVTSAPATPRQWSPPTSKQSVTSDSAPSDSAQSTDLAPNPNPDKITDEEEPATKLKPGLPTDKAAVEAAQKTSNASQKASSSSSSASASPAPAPAPAHKAKTTTSTKPATKTNTTTTTTTKPVAKAPAATRNHTKEPAKTTGTAAEKKTATSTSSTSTSSKAPEAAAKKTTAAPKPTGTVRKPDRVNLPPPSTGFNKPKPRSPTRPINLPASLTTHTASSASKFGNGAAEAAPARRSHSRGSDNAQHLNVQPGAHRSSSRSSGAARLRRQSSSNRPRPSFGPPPKQVAKDHPVVKREAHVDEGFLARMMRPTQSSSSKAAEKVPVTPPRKHNQPATAHTKRPTTKDSEGSAKKAASKIQTSSKPKTTTVTTKTTTQRPKATAKEVAPVTAQAETAEKVVGTAKASKQTATTPLVEKAEKEVPLKPTAKAAIETAKISTDTAVSPLAEKAEPEAVDEPMTPVEATAGGSGERKLASPIVVVTPEPEKVEDIEDLVQQAATPEEEKPASPAPAPATPAADPKGDVSSPTAQVPTTEEKPEEVKEEVMNVEVKAETPA